MFEKLFEKYETVLCGQDNLQTSRVSVYTEPEFSQINGRI